MDNIRSKKAEIWCTRFNQLMKMRGYTQKTFLKEYKEKYGGGTQANVSRWLRVGNVIQKNGRSKTIGFPSYENMLNIADFFGVTIGYLTGETDFKTFEMEKACRCIGIKEETGEALRNISSGKGIRLGTLRKKEIGATLRYLLTSESFPLFICELQEYAENIYRKKHSINHITIAEKQIKKEVLDMALQCLEYQKIFDKQHGKVDDFGDNNVEPTKELLEAISLLNAAIDQNYEEEMKNEREVKLSEYELQKVYFELLKEVVLDEHLSEMTLSCYEENNLIRDKIE